MQILILLMIADLKLNFIEVMAIFLLKITNDQLVEKLWNLVSMILVSRRLHSY